MKVNEHVQKRLQRNRPMATISALDSAELL